MVTKTFTVCEWCWEWVCAS